MVGAGAKILGAFEVGDNCSIAANAVLLKPLEDNVTAVGIPARPIKKDGVTLPKKRETMHVRGIRADEEPDPDDDSGDYAAEGNGKASFREIRIRK